MDVSFREAITLYQTCVTIHGLGSDGNTGRSSKAKQDLKLKSSLCYIANDENYLNASIQFNLLMKARQTN